MLIFHVTLLISTLNAALGVEQSSSSFAKPKRGIVETAHDDPQDYKFRQLQLPNPITRSIQSSNGKPLTYYKDTKAVSHREPTLIAPTSYGDVFKQPYVSLPSSVHSSAPQQSPYFDNLFTMTAGYKVANDDKPLKQIVVHQGNAYSPNQNTARGAHGAVSPAQIPVYRTSYPSSKASGPAPVFYNSPYTRKGSLPTLQAHNIQHQPVYFPSAQSQQLILQPVDPQFSYPARVPKVNNVHLSAPFLSPISSFQGQVVPISTTGTNRQFPQYKGAAIEVHPTVGGFSGVGHEPLQTQPQLHFGNGNIQYVQNIGGHRQNSPAEEIRSDVEIINKKKPTTPPPSKDDDDEEEDDEGYSSAEKEHGSDTRDDDDYESKSEKPFKAPRAEGDFKPSTSFPFKQYDSTFGKYSNRDEDDDEKPRSNYREYSSSSDDEEEEDTPSSKYQSEDASSKPYYSRQEDDEEEEDERGYEKQKTDNSYHKYRPKYFEKNFDEEFEKSYRKPFPKQSYLHRKEAPETEYGSRSSSRNKDSYDSEDSTGQGSGTSFDYQKIPQRYKDSEGQSSDAFIEMTFDKVFGHKTPDNVKSQKYRK